MRFSFATWPLDSVNATYWPSGKAQTFQASP